MNKKLFLLFVCCSILWPTIAQVPQPIRQLLNHKDMQGASLSLSVRDVTNGQTLYSYDAGRELTPASVFKLITTATALETLGPDYRYATTLAYTGEIHAGTLNGDLYIQGSGDPSLGSAHGVVNRNSFTLEQARFIPQWIDALRKAGIERITGDIIADDTVFDTEGISPKWLLEDLGNYYGAGSYGLNIFDNLYHLHLSTGAVGERPRILGTEPEISSLHFYNYSLAGAVTTDSAFVRGGPYDDNRYLYGIVPAHKKLYTIKGDMPDPPLFLAQYLRKRLLREGIGVEKEARSMRQIEPDARAGKERHTVITTYSPTLRELVRITNERSHNLYADALCKTIGLNYPVKKGQVISSFEKGTQTIFSFWQEKGLDTSALHIYDGSGLAATDKVSAGFITDLLVYMAAQSTRSEAYIHSLPIAGQEGTVRNFLRGTSLDGKARLKSGGMSRVRSYAGYIQHDGKRYAVAVIVNNYNCEGRQIIRAIEQLLVALF